MGEVGVRVGPEPLSEQHPRVGFRLGDRAVADGRHRGSVCPVVDDMAGRVTFGGAAGSVFVPVVAGAVDIGVGLVGGATMP